MPSQQKNFDPKKLYDFVEQQWNDEIVPSLCDYIKIPNKSPHFDPLWQEHGFMEQAVNHIADWCRTHAPVGAKLEIVRLEGRTPLIFIEVAGDLEETVLFYGHLDKQPEMTGWKEGLDPWQPVLQEGRLYGRGAADDGYAAYAALTAITALQKQGIPHARSVVLIEACEESGSYDLPFYIELLKERIAEPTLVICLDSGAGNYEQLWMTTSLRGNLIARLCVSTISEGVHSGNASGIVADSFRIARQLISRIEDEKTGDIHLPALYCDIPQERQQQAKYCAETLGDEVYSSFPWQEAVSPVTSDREQLILNRTWRPALTVTGADGLPSIADAGNVLRPETCLKLSMRLPPLVSAQDAAQALQDALLQQPIAQAKVSCDIDDAANGWHAPLFADWLSKAVNEASEQYYQRPAAYMGEGGTIPFMAMLGARFPKAQFMITGVLGPQSNAHGPNEFLEISMAKKLTACVAYVLMKASQIKS